MRIFCFFGVLCFRVRARTYTQVCVCVCFPHGCVRSMILYVRSMYSYFEVCVFSMTAFACLRVFARFFVRSSCALCVCFVCLVCVFFIFFFVYIWRG